MASLSDELGFVNPPEWKKALDRYLSALPEWVYVRKQDGGTYQLPLKDAISWPIIQYNQKFSIKTLVFDVDHEDAHFRWQDQHVPHPNIVSTNPRNGHSHLFYFIRNKIYKNNIKNRKPFKLLTAIEETLRQKLEADRGFAGFVAKNPLNTDWITEVFHNQLYDLYDLQDELEPLPWAKVDKKLSSAGLGRNCTLFEHLRYEAYSTVHRFSKDQDIWSFQQYLFELGMKKNLETFATPLHRQEVGWIAKSIARWTIVNMTYTTFVKIQTARANRLARKRTEKKEELYKKIILIKQDNPFIIQKDIAEKFGVSVDTVQRAFKTYKTREIFPSEDGE